MPVDALPPIEPAFELNVATQGMSKGALQSEGVQVAPKLIVKAKQFQLSGQWKNIDSNSAKGEGTLAGGWSGKLGATELGGSVGYKFLTSAKGSGNRESVEFVGNVSRKFGKLGLKASATFSPNDFGATKQSLWLEAGPSLDLPYKFKASAALGWRTRSNNRDYVAFNAGLSRPLGKLLTLDVRYFDTNKGEFGETFDNRVVGSIKLTI